MSLRAIAAALGMAALCTAMVAWPAVCTAQEHGRPGEHGEAAEHGEASGEHGEHEGLEWGAIRGERPGLAWSFVNFGVWLALLYFGLRRPVSEFLANRRAAVVDGMEEAARVKADAEAKHKEYSERIENLDAELERLREEVRRGGMAERDRIVAEAARKAEKMREEARFLIDQQMKQLRADLTREAIEAAVRTAGEILVKETGPEDQERLARDYLSTIRESLERKSAERRS